MAIAGKKDESTLQNQPSAELRDKLLSRRIIQILMLCFCYITVSAGLISHNRYLMHEGRFPYGSVISLVQTGFCSLVAGILYMLVPSLFLASDKIDRTLFMKGSIPVGFLFSAQLMLANTAYLHSSVAFLQMMKESNVVLVYIFSVFAMLESFSRRNVCAIICVLIPTAFTIEGDVHFSVVGFALQGISQLFESARIVWQALLLSSAGRKLDPMTYVLVVMPCSFFFLTAMLVIIAVSHAFPIFALPQMSEVIAWFPILIGNASIAFALNWVIAALMKASSPMAFILAGIVKDCVMVLVGFGLFNETVTSSQLVGFSFQLNAVLIWSLMKAFPDEFETGVINGITSVLFGQQPELLPASKQENQQYGTVDGGKEVNKSEKTMNENKYNEATP